ncbi:MAG: 16S rRNA methyltransferase [Candidatus Thermoplasmatota archaeon]|nr:16S rRNA methyltransferase [Candidatus Thermoplasmatota archaeon]
MNFPTLPSKKISLVFVETELELIPTSISSHPQVIAYAHKRGKQAQTLLLDSTYHHNAMRLLPDWKRRGRPDIIHRCLLFALDSYINREGLLDMYIHTRNDMVISVNPLVRLPKHYQRFLGLIEQLYEKGTISSATEKLLILKQQSLSQLLETLPKRSYLLSEKGKTIGPISLFKKVILEPIVIGIGCFPHGDFTKNLALFSEQISLGESSFSASTTTAKVLFSYEEALKQSQ